MNLFSTAQHNLDLPARKSRTGTNAILRLCGLCFLFVAGFAVSLAAAFANNLGTRGFELISRIGLAKALIILTLGAALSFLLIRFPEIALALFFLVGLVKGDPRLASTPVDLTIFVASIVVLSILVRLMSGGRTLQFPKEYILYIPLLAMMAISLIYTPDFTSGLDKTLRFICLTGIGIIAPFVLFDSRQKVRRFLITMALGGLLLAVNSLTMLGGEDRLVSPSGLNTELGAASAVALIVLWGLLLPNLSFFWRVLTYPLFGILALALIGSGGRFANVSTVICLLIGIFFCKRLLGDAAIITGLSLALLPFGWIPQASYQYLESLAHPPQAMETRSDLMTLGVKVFSDHPLFGVGIHGFSSLSPNPLTYNYPHNLFLELGSEMGVVALLAFLALVVCSFREAFRQLTDLDTRDDAMVHTIFLLLIFVFMDAMVSGDINDLRFMWFVLALPFVLRHLSPNFYLLPRQAGWVTQPPSSTLTERLP